MFNIFLLKYHTKEENHEKTLISNCHLNYQINYIRKWKTNNNGLFSKPRMYNQVDKYQKIGIEWLTRRTIMKKTIIFAIKK